MHSIPKLTALLAATAFLSACDPAFKTTAEKCALNQDAAVIIGVPSYEVTAGADEYKLYLEDTILALEPASALTSPSDEEAALLFTKTTINSYLQYAETSGIVSSAINPLDFLESIVATTDPNIEIEAFVIAKQQIAAGVAADDGYCTYSNDNIVLTDGSSDANVLAYAELGLSYDPFQRIVQQSILIAENNTDLDSSTTRQTVPYVGFFQSIPSDFKAVGFTEAQVRQSIVRNLNEYESLSFDDGRDTKLGQLLLDYSNLACDQTSTNANIADLDDCPVGTTTRAPAKTQCAGEANKIEEHSFDLSPSHTSLKRLRVEANYTTGEVEFYASAYREAIYDSDDTTPILDPTNCEKQAVLDELAAASPGQGVILRTIPDPNYDIEFVVDANGDPVLDGNGVQQEVLPTPVLSYTGTIVPSRQ
jgi:hypothetical protein